MGAFCLGASKRVNAYERSDSMRLLQLLVPHLQRAARSQWTMDCAIAGRNVAFAALARLRHGVVLVGAGGRVLFANDAAAKLAAQTDGLSIGAAGLRAALPSQDAALQRLSARAFASNGNSVPAGGMLAVSRPSGRRPYAVFVIPLREVAETFMTYCPCAVAVIVDPDDPLPIFPRHLQELYGLTPAEAAVAIQMLRGQGLKAVAAELRVTLSTVRIHLQRVFEKTGTHRQAELTRLLICAQTAFEPPER